MPESEIELKLLILFVSTKQHNAILIASVSRHLAFRMCPFLKYFPISICLWIFRHLISAWYSHPYCSPHNSIPVILLATSTSQVHLFYIHTPILSPSPILYRQWLSFASTPNVFLFHDCLSSIPLVYSSLNIQSLPHPSHYLLSSWEAYAWQMVDTLSSSRSSLGHSSSTHHLVQIFMSPPFILQNNLKNLLLLLFPTFAEFPHNPSFYNPWFLSSLDLSLPIIVPMTLHTQRLVIPRYFLLSRIQFLPANHHNYDTDDNSAAHLNHPSSTTSFTFQTSYSSHQRYSSFTLTSYLKFTFQTDYDSP